MRGPPDTIIEEVAVAGDGGSVVSGRRLANIDFSEYEWMGEEGVEEFDRKCMEELWAEEFMDMVLVNVLENDNEEVVDFLLPIYENMMQQMTLADDGNEEVEEGAGGDEIIAILDGDAEANSDNGLVGFDDGFYCNDIQGDGSFVCLVTAEDAAELERNHSLDNSFEDDDCDDYDEELR